MRMKTAIVESAAILSGTEADVRKRIKPSDVAGDGTVAGMADGIRCDTEGNVWSSAGWVGPGYDGVHIFAPDGQRIGLILLPEICSNVCFGGPRRNRLFMTGSQSLYSVYVEAKGAHWC